MSGTGLLDPATVINGLGLAPDMRVADFGAGSGHFTVLISQKVGPQGKVSAIDVQEAPLDSIRAKAKALGLTNIETLRADLEVPGSSGLSDGSQDVVLLANVLFQSKQKSAIIREAKRVLREGGRLILIEWKKGTGGFGPPDDLRMNEEEISRLIQTEGLAAAGDIDVGKFHHVLTFTK